MADEWVTLSKTEEEAQKFFMKRFFIQNADIIADDAQLSPFFADQLEGRPISSNAYGEFAQAVGMGSIRKCGFIVDEAQKLVAAAKSEFSIIGRDGFPVTMNKQFFSTDFTLWTGLSRGFCSQLCASSHGLREFQLPSGEEHRLRFVAPFSRETGLTLLGREESPFYVKPDNDVASDKLALTMQRLTGWMPRSMQKAALSCRAEGNKDGFEKFKYDEYYDMEAMCQNQWLNTIHPDEKVVVLSHIPDVILGNIHFRPREKILYDHGVLYCNAAGKFEPVSRLAADMLYMFYLRQMPTGLDPADKLYWKALEAAVIKNILRRSVGSQVNVFRLDGSGWKCAPWAADEAKWLPGTSIEKIAKCIKQDDKETILYVPLDSNCTFDAILLPPVRSMDPILVIDPSVTDPYKSNRIAKYKSWQQNVVPMLRKKFASHDVVCVAVWPEQYTIQQAAKRIPHKDENKQALAMTYLLEETEMKLLGVEINYQKAVNTNVGNTNV